MLEQSENRIEILENGRYIAIEKRNQEFEIFILDTESHDMAMGFLHENGDYFHGEKDEVLNSELIQVTESAFPVAIETPRTWRRAIFNATHHNRILVPLQERVLNEM